MLRVRVVRRRVDLFVAILGRWVTVCRSRMMTALLGYLSFKLLAERSQLLRNGLIVREIDCFNFSGRGNCLVQVRGTGGSKSFLWMCTIRVLD